MIPTTLSKKLVKVGSHIYANSIHSSFRAILQVIREIIYPSFHQPVSINKKYNFL